MPEEDENSEIVAILKKELESSLENKATLEKENNELRQEIGRLKAQITSLKAHNNERKSVLWKKFQNSMDSNSYIDVLEQIPPKEKMGPKQDLNNESQTTKEIRPARSSVTDALPPPRPPPTPPNKGPLAPAAPPPPPPPSKSLLGSKAIRRVPEVIELYRSLTRKDPHMENKANPAGVHAFALTKNMIGEIENRSSYLLAIKSEVETQAEFINFLINEVVNAKFANMDDVETFVTWVDRQLSSLVDERAVLKHFPQWPERKADTLREAAFSYRDLRNLKNEASSFEDNSKEPLVLALRRIEALQDRLERSVSSTERARESASKRYRDFQIPWEWMLDTGLIGQMKMSSLRLAKEYMKRIIREVMSSEGSKEDSRLLQGVRFAFRVHQFAGGFDSETVLAFEELKKIGTSSSRNGTV